MIVLAIKPLQFVSDLIRTADSLRAWDNNEHPEIKFQRCHHVKPFMCPSLPFPFPPFLPCLTLPDPVFSSLMP